jgi:hypothetical protein
MDDGAEEGWSTLEDDTEGALADFLANAVVDADDVVGSGGMRRHCWRYVLAGGGMDKLDLLALARLSLFKPPRWRKEITLEVRFWPN